MWGYQILWHRICWSFSLFPDREKAAFWEFLDPYNYQKRVLKLWTWHLSKKLIKISSKIQNCDKCPHLPCALHAAFSHLWKTLIIYVYMPTYLFCFINSKGKKKIQIICPSTYKEIKNTDKPRLYIAIHIFFIFFSCLVAFISNVHLLFVL